MYGRYYSKDHKGGSINSLTENKLHEPLISNFVLGKRQLDTKSDRHYSILCILSARKENHGISQSLTLENLREKEKKYSTSGNILELKGPTAHLLAIILCNLVSDVLLINMTK